jgi:cobalamin biosynthesis Mg chelatase CobN
LRITRGVGHAVQETDGVAALRSPSLASDTRPVRWGIQSGGAGARAMHRERSAHQCSKERAMPSLIWIIIVVLVVLALLGYFGRGRFGG